MRGRTVFLPSAGEFSVLDGYENNNNQNECYVYGSEGETPRRLDGYETDSLTTMFLDHLADHVGGEEDYQRFLPCFRCSRSQSLCAAYQSGSRCAPDSSVGYSASSQCAKCSPNPRAGSLDHAGYYAMVENLDYNVGRIRMALKDMGVDRETYLIFFSDHGDMLWSHAQTGKSSPWEESVRIPFIIGKVGGGANMNTVIYRCGDQSRGYCAYDAGSLRYSRSRGYGRVRLFGSLYFQQCR